MPSIKSIKKDTQTLRAEEQEEILNIKRISSDFADVIHNIQKNLLNHYLINIMIMM